MAHRSVGFRIIEGALNIVGVIGLLLLLTLGKEYIKAGSPLSSFFQTSGVLLLAALDWVNLMVMLVFSLGVLMYYYILCQSRLIPRGLSGWALVGVSSAVAAIMLVMCRLIGSMSTIQVVLYLPIAFLEMVLAVWLITEGFKPSAIASGSA